MKNLLGGDFMQYNYLNYYPGTMLKKIRMSKNLKTSDLCEDLISTSYYSKVEANQSVPSLAIFLALIYRLNVSSTEFFYLSRDYQLSEKEIFGNFLSNIEYRDTDEINTFLEYTQREFNYSNDSTFQAYHQTALFFMDRTEDITVVTTHLSKIDSWYIQDLIIFSLVSSTYSDEYIDIQCDLLNKKLKKYISYPNANSILPMIIYRMTIRLASLPIDIFEYHCLYFLEILHEIKLLDSRMIYLFLADLLKFLKEKPSSNEKLLNYLHVLDIMEMEPLKIVIEADLEELGII